MSVSVISLRQMELIRAWRVWRIVSIAITTVGMVMWWSIIPIASHYVNDFPRQPDRSSGHTISKNMHGLVVYQTKHQNDVYTTLEAGGYSLVLLGAAIFTYSNRRREHSDPDQTIRFNYIS